MGGGIVNGGALHQTSTATRLESDGHGGTGGMLCSSVVGEILGGGDTVPGSFGPVSTPSCPFPLRLCTLIGDSRYSLRSKQKSDMTDTLSKTEGLGMADRKVLNDPQACGSTA